MTTFRPACWHSVSFFPRILIGQAQDPEDFPVKVDNTYRKEFSHFAESALTQGLSLRSMRPAVWTDVAGPHVYPKITKDITGFPLGSVTYNQYGRRRACHADVVQRVPRGRCARG